MLHHPVNQVTPAFHVRGLQAGDLDRPEFVPFDLDPGKATFTDSAAAARGGRG